VLGLFGKKITQDYVLRSGDRIEICRPLINDPRDMRRKFIFLGRVMGQRDNKA
jgi:putative ubiquitin-RnfH superfamily antitoxin RatB of RatAB toxin-antitoxin module